MEITGLSANRSWVDYSTTAGKLWTTILSDLAPSDLHPVEALKSTQLSDFAKCFDPQLIMEISIFFPRKI